MGKNKTLSKEELQHKRTSYYISYMFYGYEITHETYTRDKEIIKSRIKGLKQLISEYDIEEETKEEMLKNSDFLEILAHIDQKKNNYLTDKRLYEYLKDYNEINNFFTSHDTIQEAIKVYDLYGIVDIDTNGNYILNDAITNQLIEDNNLYITGDKQRIKNLIFDTWENQTEIITSDILDKSSEKQNGLSFKKCLFCEEYLKSSNIKATCEYLGISRNTAYLWLKEDTVQEYLKSRQEEIKKDTQLLLKTTYNTCFNELNKMVNSEFINNTDKIKAIDTFLKHYENIERLNQPLSYED